MKVTLLPVKLVVKHLVDVGVGATDIIALGIHQVTEVQLVTDMHEDTLWTKTRKLQVGRPRPVKILTTVTDG